ncbi:MAG: hypothetical protein IKP40_08900 [Clostridia bacterium]|nr:hypothetical protein [Clostridia bacterium]
MAELNRRKPKITMIDPTDEDLQAILMCAVRYAIGRATYMPGLVTDWIMGNMAGKLSYNTLSVMKRDIDMVPVERRGMDCDQRTWARFREWLDRQEVFDGQTESV